VARLQLSSATVAQSQHNEVTKPDLNSSVSVAASGDWPAEAMRDASALREEGDATIDAVDDPPDRHGSAAALRCFQNQKYGSELEPLGFLASRVLRY
jgi:hypothetical protein